MSNTMNWKFWIRDVKITVVAKGQRQAEVTMVPVVRKTEDNVEWSRYTPVGEFRFTVTQESAIVWFLVHQGEDVDLAGTVTSSDVSGVDYDERERISKAFRDSLVADGAVA